jgi:hypothetical protein
MTAFAVVDLPAGSTKAIGGPDQRTNFNFASAGTAAVFIACKALDGSAVSDHYTAGHELVNQVQWFGSTFQLGATGPCTLVVSNSGPDAATVTLHQAE